MPHRPSRAAAALAFALALPATLAAGPVAAAQPDFDRALLCRSVADGPARLACYDAAMADGAADASPGPVAATPRAAPAAAPAMTAEAAFGATKEMIAEASGAPEDLDEITSAIVEAKANARGALTLRLANGQVWREVSDYGRAPLRKDQKDLTAKISRGAMGKFRMRLLPTRHIIRVERVE